MELKDSKQGLSTKQMLIAKQVPIARQALIKIKILNFNFSFYNEIINAKKYISSYTYYFFS